jgi:hypothetical protein
MEKSKILANTASLTAEQLFEEIKAGNVTLEALMQTGDLNVVKRNKINSLLNELEEQEEADWLDAENGGDEASYSAYLANHPAGKHVAEARQIISFLERQRENSKIQKQKILNELRNNPNSYNSSQISSYLHHTISIEELMSCGIPLSAIENIQNVEIQQLELGRTPEAIPSGFTEVYFWGAPGSGKTCALGALLQVAQKKGFLNLATGPGYRYATQLMNIFSDDGEANDYLPGPTPLENTQYLPFTLKRPNESAVRSVSLIELSGEIFKCFFDLTAGDPLQSQSHVDTFNTLNSFLKNNNRKIHFFFIDYNRNNRPDHNGITQSNYLAAASTYFKNHKIFNKSTDAIFIVLTKSDLMRDDSGNEVRRDQWVEYARNYLNENNYKSFINTLKDICKKEGINGGKLTVEPFSLGKVYFQQICDFNGSSASNLVEILMERVPGNRASIFDVFNS